MMKKLKPNLFAMLLLASLAQLPAYADINMSNSNPTITSSGSPELTPSEILAINSFHSNTGNQENFLTDRFGRSLYIFELDTQGQSNCTGQCAEVWPPFLVPSQHILSNSGGASSVVGTILRSDGTAQVTFNGMPLYLYAQDKMPGDMTGQGMNSFGGKWWLVHPDGSRMETAINNMTSVAPQSLENTTTTPITPSMDTSTNGYMNSNTGYMTPTESTPTSEYTNTGSTTGSTGETPTSTTMGEPGHRGYWGGNYGGYPYYGGGYYGGYGSYYPYYGGYGSYYPYYGGYYPYYYPYSY